MNMAVSYALKNAVVVENEDITMDYTKLLFASGSIQFPETITAQRSQEDSVNITWDTTLALVDDSADELNLVAMNVKNHFTIVRETCFARCRAI